MSRRAARFTEADLFRAAKAAKRAGMAVEALPDGTIRLISEQTERGRDTITEPPPKALI